MLCQMKSKKPVIRFKVAKLQSEPKYKSQAFIHKELLTMHL